MELRGNGRQLPFKFGRSTHQGRHLLLTAGERSPAVAPSTTCSSCLTNLIALGTDVKEKALGRASLGMLAVVSVLLAACGTPPAKDFKGSWHPVNRYQSAPTEIPLQNQYTFFAAPIDETLKSMLTRWANDTDRSLDYQLSDDVTLYRPVATIRTTDIEAAAAELNKIYAAQGVRVIAKSGEILVQSANTVPFGAGSVSTDTAKPKAAKP